MSVTNKLRNKPGGMAWIRGIKTPSGEEVLNGRAVRTVRLINDDCWEVAPPQDFVSKVTIKMYDGSVVGPCRLCSTIGLKDEFLEPWKDIGDDAEDESKAYLPPVPTREVA